MGRGVFNGIFTGIGLALLILGAMSFWLPEPGVTTALVRDAAGTSGREESVAAADGAIDPAITGGTSVADQPESSASGASPTVPSAAEDPAAGLDAPDNIADAAPLIEAAPSEAGVSTPETGMVEVPAGSEFARAGPEEDPLLPGALPAPETATAPLVRAPDVETAPELADVRPAEAPDSQSAAPNAMDAPQEAMADGAGSVSQEAPVGIPPPGEVVTPHLAEVAPDRSATTALSGADINPAERPTTGGAESEPLAAAPQPDPSAAPGIATDDLRPDVLAEDLADLPRDAADDPAPGGAEMLELPAPPLVRGTAPDTPLSPAPEMLTEERFALNDPAEAQTVPSQGAPGLATPESETGAAARGADPTGGDRPPEADAPALGAEPLAESGAGPTAEPTFSAAPVPVPGDAPDSGQAPALAPSSAGPERAPQIATAPVPTPPSGTTEDAPEGALLIPVRPLPQVRNLPIIEDPATPESEPVQNEQPGAAPALPQVTDIAPSGPIGVATAPRPGFRDAPGVRVNRLPTIGGGAADPGEADVDAADGAGPATDPGIASGDMPAISRFAAAFEPVGNTPLLSIILVDTGTEANGLDRDTLMTLPIPVTIALDPTRPGAEEAAIAYRDAGFEVVILASSLPDGAQPADLEIAFQSFQRTIPEAVGVIDGPAARLQSNRRLSQQLVEVLTPTGLGLFTYDVGLNPARQLAAARDIAQANIYRVLDAEEENPETILRYLDRAAFEAGQTGSVVVVAHNYPDTVTALFTWAARNITTVVPAPASAVARSRAGS